MPHKNKILQVSSERKCSQFLLVKHLKNILYSSDIKFFRHSPSGRESESFSICLLYFHQEDHKGPVLRKKNLLEKKLPKQLLLLVQWIVNLQVIQATVIL